MDSKRDSTRNLAGNSDRIEGVQGQNRGVWVGVGEADKLYNNFSNFEHQISNPDIFENLKKILWEGKC